MNRLSVMIIVGMVFGVFMAWAIVAHAQEEIPVFNGSFEVLPEGVQPEEALGKMPYGWSASLGSLEVTEAVLSDEKAYEGKYSLKISVSEPATILTASRPIPIEPGQTYAAMWRIYNVRDLPVYASHLHVYMEFWGSDGGWWGDTDYWSRESWEAQRRGSWSTSKRLSTTWTTSREFGQWEDVLVIAQAPENATHVTLSLWVPRKTLISYVDDVQFGLLDE
jgi:hypothetical protein